MRDTHPQIQSQPGCWFLRLLGILFMRPSKEERYADDGARYRKNGHVTAFGVFLYFWDHLLDRWEDPDFEPNLIERIFLWFERWIPPHPK